MDFWKEKYILYSFATASRILILTTNGLLRICHCPVGAVVGNGGSQIPAAVGPVHVHVEVRCRGIIQALAGCESVRFRCQSQSMKAPNDHFYYTHGHTPVPRAGSTSCPACTLRTSAGSSHLRSAVHWDTGSDCGQTRTTASHPPEGPVGNQGKAGLCGDG